MATFDRADIRARVQSYLGDATTRVWSTDELNRAINEGAMLTAKVLRAKDDAYWRVRLENIDNSTPSSSYTLPTSPKCERVIFFRNGYGDSSAVVLPHYTVDANKISWGEPIALKKAILIYVRAINEMTADSDFPDVPADYREAVVYISCAIALLKKNVATLEPYISLWAQAINISRDDAIAWVLRGRVAQ
jgi:hypothetical protein